MTISIHFIKTIRTSLSRCLYWIVFDLSKFYFFIYSQILTYSNHFYSRAAGDSGSAVTYFEESVQFLLKLPTDDLEVNALLP